MGFDPVDYLLAMQQAGRAGGVEVIMTNATFTDTDSDGNIVITEEAS